MSTSQPPEGTEAPATPAPPITPMVLASDAIEQTRVERSGPDSSLSAFESHASFQAAIPMAKALAQSTMIPSEYRGNTANCLVAMELASRTGAGIMAVMQNTHIINGRPSWASTFLIGSVNSCGRFTALRYETRGGDDPKQKSYAVRAYSTEKATGDKLIGEWIDWAMVEGEGWSKKNGSKWLTMPGQMFRYRAAAFWTRSYAPEISLGMHSSDEIEDVVTPTVTATAVAAATTGADKLRALVDPPTTRRESAVETEEIAPVVEEAPVSRKATPPKSEPVPQEDRETYVQRMKTLQMRRDTKKPLTKTELDELIKFEAIHE